MKVYTGSGDAGYTNFGQVHKIPKNDLHIEFCGTIDELNSFIGLLVCELGSHNDLDTSFLEKCQSQLFSVCTVVVCPELSDDQFLSWVHELEYEIDEMTSQLPSQRSFILPGGCRSAALSHVCRTVCRRAERVLVSLQNEANVDKGILPYLNRLSDYLYVLALKLNNINNVDEKKWQNICK